MLATGARLKGPRAAIGQRQALAKPGVGRPPARSPVSTGVTGKTAPSRVLGTDAAPPPDRSLALTTPTSPHPVDLHVGARLHQARLLRRLSQAALGDAIGVSFQQIQKYERGTNRLSASALFRLSVFLQRPVAWFFEDLAATGDPASAPDPVRALLATSEGAEMALCLANLAPPVRRKLLAVVRAFVPDSLDAAG